MSGESLRTNNPNIYSYNWHFLLPQRNADPHLLPFVLKIQKQLCPNIIKLVGYGTEVDTTWSENRFEWQTEKKSELTCQTCLLW